MVKAAGQGEQPAGQSEKGDLAMRHRFALKTLLDVHGVGKFMRVLVIGRNLRVRMLMIMLMSMVTVVVVVSMIVMMSMAGLGL